MTPTGTRNINQYFSEVEQLRLEESGEGARLERLQQVIDVRLDYLEAGMQERYHRLVAELQRIRSTESNPETRLNEMIALTEQDDYRIEISENTPESIPTNIERTITARTGISTTAVRERVDEAARDIPQLGVAGAIMLGMSRIMHNVLNWFRRLFGIEEVENPEARRAREEAAEEAGREREEAEAAEEAGRERVGETLAGPEGLFSNISGIPLVDEKIQELSQDRTIFSEADINTLSEIDPLNMEALREVLGPEKINIIIDRIRNDPEVVLAIREYTISQSAEQIQEAYGVHLNQTQRQRFREIYEHRFGNNRNVAEATISSFLNGEPLNIGNLLFVSAGLAKDTALFFFDITRAGIIPLSAIALSISETGILTLTLPFYAIGLGNDHSFIEVLEGRSEEERRFILASLYRQTGIFTSVLANASYAISRLALDSTISTGNSFVDRISAVFGGIDTRIRFFENIESRFNSSGINMGGIMQEVHDSLRRIQINYRIIHILDNATPGTLENSLDALRNLRLGDQTLNLPSTVRDVDDLRRSVHLFQVGPVGNNNLMQRHYWKRFYPGLEQFGVRFGESLRNIFGYQEMRKSGMINAGMLRRIREASAIFSLHRFGDRLLIEARNLSDARNTMDSLRSLAHDSPGLFRSLFGGIATIGFVGLDASMKEEDTSLFESIARSLAYMSGIVGPIAMIWSAGASIRDGDLTFFNVAEAGAGVVFLGLDTASAARLGIRNGGASRIVGEIVLRPVNDVRNMLPHLARFGQNSIGVARGIATGTRSINIGSSLRQALNPRSLTGLGQAAIRGLRTGRGRLAIGAAAVAMGGYLLLPNRTPEFQHLVDAGVMDENGNLTAIDSEGNIIPENISTLRTYLTDLRRSEREALITVIVHSGVEDFILGPEGNFSISLNGNTVEVTGESAISSGDWLVQPQIASLLSELGYSTEIIPYQGADTAYA